MSLRWLEGSAARTLVAGIALVIAPFAVAQESKYESPRWGAVEVSLSGYRPNVDAEFAGSASPFQTAFGGGRGLMFRTDLSKSVLIGDYGTLDVGIGAGYWEKVGQGQIPGGGASGDGTMLRVVPSRVSVTYRYDHLALHYPIPLAPYVRLSLDRYWWWVYNGAGHVSQAAGVTGSGATNGYSFSGGIALLLNFIDRGLGRDMDRETGVNQVYAFVDFTKSYVKDFGSSTSWDLSDSTVTIAGGLLFVF